MGISYEGKKLKATVKISVPKKRKDAEKLSRELKNLAARNKKTQQ